MMKQCMHAQSLSRVQLLVTPWTVAHHAPLSMGYSRQEYWSGLPYSSPGMKQCCASKAEIKSNESLALLNSMVLRYSYLNLFKKKHQDLNLYAGKPKQNLSLHIKHVCIFS